MLISIITVSLNNEKGLHRTLVSLSNQSYKDFELIVIDGESTDDSLEVIKEFSHLINHSVWEKDTGIYDAMNKGWRLAAGSFCLFLNAGDELHSPEVLSNVARLLVSSQADIVFGDITGIAKNGSATNSNFEEPVSLHYLFRWFVPHPSSFIRKTLLEKLEGYPTDYRIISDWIFTVLAFCQSAKFEHLPTIVSNFYMDGISTNQLKLMGEEREKAFENELSFLKWDWQWYKKVRPLELSRSVKLLHRLITYVRS